MGQRDRSLRQYLMAYGAALLVPVLLLAVVLVWQFARAEEVQNEEKARAAAQQIIAAVDRELAGLQAAGLALASSAALRAGNFERVQRRAAEIIGRCRIRRTMPSSSATSPASCSSTPASPGARRCRRAPTPTPTRR